MPDLPTDLRPSEKAILVSGPARPPKDIGENHRPFPNLNIINKS